MTCRPAGDHSEDEHEEDEEDEEFRKYRLARLQQMQSVASASAKLPTFGSVEAIAVDDFPEACDAPGSVDTYVVACLQEDYLPACVRLSYKLEALAAKYDQVRFISVSASAAKPDFDPDRLPCLIIYHKNGEFAGSLERVGKEAGESLTMGHVEEMLQRLGVRLTSSAAMKAADAAALHRLRELGGEIPASVHNGGAHDDDDDDEDHRGRNDEDEDEEEDGRSGGGDLQLASARVFGACLACRSADARVHVVLKYTRFRIDSGFAFVGCVRSSRDDEKYLTVAKVTLGSSDSYRLLLFGLTTHACDKSSLARGSRSLRYLMSVLSQPLSHEFGLFACATIAPTRLVDDATACSVLLGAAGLVAVHRVRWSRFRRRPHRRRSPQTHHCRPPPASPRVCALPAAGAASCAPPLLPFPAFRASRRPHSRSRSAEPRRAWTRHAVWSLRPPRQWTSCPPSSGTLLLYQIDEVVIAVKLIRQALLRLLELFEGTRCIRVGRLVRMAAQRQFWRLVHLLWRDVPHGLLH